MKKILLEEMMMFDGSLSASEAAPAEPLGFDIDSNEVVLLY